MFCSNSHFDLEMKEIKGNEKNVCLITANIKYAGTQAKRQILVYIKT